MNKKAVVITAIVLAGLSGCSSAIDDSVSNVNDNSTNLDLYQSIVSEECASVSEETSVFEDTTDDGWYNIYIDTVDASEVMECRYHTLPDEINGAEYVLCKPYDLKSILVELFYNGLDSENNRVGVGIYDLESGEYTNITDFSGDGRINYYDRDYIVFYNWNEQSLSLYDSEKKDADTFFYVSEKMNFTPFAMTIESDCLYFDMYVRDENDVYVPCIYRYDIDNKELIVFADNCEKYISIEGKQYVVTNSEKDKKYNSLCKFGELDNESMKIRDGTSDIFCINGEVYGEYDNGACSVIADFTNDKKLLETYPQSGEILTELNSEGFFLAWSDNTGYKSYPCIFDAENKKVVKFSDFGLSYYTTVLNDDIGMIYELKPRHVVDSDINESRVCLFRKKNH